MAEGTDGEESKGNINSFQVAVIGAGLSGTRLTRYLFAFAMLSFMMMCFHAFLVFLRFVCSKGPSGIQY